ncbi:MAG: cation:proton antiporter [Deltaproteobacteria bacterium]|nr:cation:proton antiporter [Deltaproteobacteria bacterium]
MGPTHALGLLVTLAAGLTAALAFGYLTQRLGLSPIVGYLLAGLALGPATPGFVADRAISEQLAEVGVILLMFGVGLQFHFKELLSVRRIAVPGAAVQIVAATALGTAGAMTVAGWSAQAGIVFGLAIAVASTVVLVRVLSDGGHLHTPVGHIAVGWLVVEDIFTVLVLVLLPLAEARRDAGVGAAALAVVLAIAKIGGLAAFAVLVGGRVIPWLLHRVAATGSRELFTLTILVVALGIAVGSARAFGVSMALGAFLAGMVVGRSEFSLRAASEALPMRDAFSVLFFASVGMLFDPAHVVESPGLVVVTVAVVMVGKPFAAVAICAVLGYPSRVGFAVAAALAQVGEFSFILAALGKQVGILPDDAVDAVVATAMVSISLNPLIYRSASAIEARLAGRSAVWRLLNARVRAGTEEALPDEADPAHRAVIVGYGPVGRTLARLLREQGIEPSVIEMNLSTIQRLRGEGATAFYGDATLRTTLEAAGVARAGTFVWSVSGVPGAGEAIRVAREVNPRIRIVARARYLAEARTLREAGADRVFAGEGEVALAMTEAVLADLGATPEQIDRERRRVHEELF